MLKHYLTMVLAAFLLLAVASASTIHVPVNYTTIQAAINASLNGDTILVADGTYPEHITFMGKAIVVISENGAETTIIEKVYDNQAIISFSSGEDENSVLSGFTVRNSYDRAAIICDGSSPVIKNCIIEDNYNIIYDPGSSGSGILFKNNAAPRITKNIIRDNYAMHGAGLSGAFCDEDHQALIDSNLIYNNETHNNGAGFSAFECSFIFRYNLVYNNHAGLAGGGLRIDAKGGVVENNTICNNTAESIAGGIFTDGSFSVATYIRNNIFYGNSLYGFTVYNGSNFHLRYNCFYGNDSGPYNNIVPEEGNIYEDPLFWDESNDEYHLTAGSPCINTGDPTSPLDPDGSIADMGALCYAPIGYGYLIGLVEDIYGSPIENVLVRLANAAFSDSTDLAGEYYIDSIYAPAEVNVYFIHPNYKDTAVSGISIEIDETTSLNMVMQPPPPPGAIGGIVTDESLSAIEGVIVETYLGQVVDTSDINGEYLLDNLEPGSFMVNYTHPDYFDTSITPVIVNSGETTVLNITMAGKGYIDGVITDSISRPIANVLVDLIGSESQSFSNSNGEYILDNVPIGNRSVLFSHSAYVDTTIDNIEVTAGDTVSQNVTMRLIPPDIFLWFGGAVEEGVWLDTVYAVPGDTVSVDVWISCAPDVYSADICCPLGISRDYFTGFEPSACRYYYPFTEWPDKLFSNAATYTEFFSYTFLGFAIGPMDHGPWLHFDVPTRILSFNTQTIDNAEFIGHTYTDALRQGNDPIQGPPNSGDTLGMMGYLIIDSYAHVCFDTIFNGYAYLPGDVNMRAGIWPPAAIGSDVTYLVGFFRGVPSNLACYLNGFWASADINGDCNVIGSDVTRLVNFLKGTATIAYCPDYPPLWFNQSDLPAEMPAGWPNCDDEITAISGGARTR